VLRDGGVIVRTRKVNDPVSTARSVPSCQGGVLSKIPNAKWLQHVWKGFDEMRVGLAEYIHQWVKT